MSRPIAGGRHAEEPVAGHVGSKASADPVAAGMAGGDADGPEQHAIARQVPHAASTSSKTCCRSICQPRRHPRNARRPGRRFRPARTAHQSWRRPCRGHPTSARRELRRSVSGHCPRPSAHLQFPDGARIAWGTVEKQVRPCLFWPFWRFIAFRFCGFRFLASRLRRNLFSASIPARAAGSSIVIHSYAHGDDMIDVGEKRDLVDIGAGDEVVHAQHAIERDLFL